MAQVNDYTTGLVVLRRMIQAHAWVAWVAWVVIAYIHLQWSVLQYP